VTAASETATPRTVDLDQALFRVTADGDCFLVGGKCRSCGAVTWGLRPMCPQCWAEGTQEEIPIGRRGTLYSAATVRHAAPGFTPPYMMGVIDLAEGVRVIGRVIAPEMGAWSKDAAVTLQAGRLGVTPAGDEVLGPVFRIVREVK
jgi:uncharacterized OB-fold protein